MKKGRIILLSFALLTFVISLKAQSFVLYGDKTCGGNKSEFLSNFLLQPNGRFVLAGWGNSLLTGDVTDPLCDSVVNNDDIWLVEVDTAFNIYWNKNLGGNDQETNSELLNAGNSNMIFISRSTSDSSCEKSENNRSGFVGVNGDYWICKIDSNGNKLWDKTFGSAYDEGSPNLLELSSGDYIAAGISGGTGISGDKTVYNYGASDFWLIKFDSFGNKIWDKVYGGINDEFGQPVLLSNPDNTFIMAGTVISPASGTISDSSRGGQDIWIVKLDSAGTPLWDKRYGGSGNDYTQCLMHTPDGGYMLCGSTNSPQGADVSDTSRGLADVWLLKLDSTGNKQWDRRYGGNNNDSGAEIKPAAGGGFWIAGTTRSDAGSDVSEPSYGVSDYWILKIDSVGNKVWDKRFGGPGFDACTSFIIMPDSSIFLGGYAASGISPVKADSGKGLSDYWLVHFKYTDNNTGINENTNENNLITIYPNPTKGKIVLTSPFGGQGAVYIYDVMGKEVYSKKNVLLNHYEMDVSGFDKGVYFLKVKTNERGYTKKIVKM